MNLVVQSEDDGTDVGLLRVLTECMRPEIDLYWSIGVLRLATVQEYYSGMPSQFSCRRLILDCEHWAEEVSHHHFICIYIRDKSLIS